MAIKIRFTELHTWKQNVTKHQWYSGWTGPIVCVCSTEERFIQPCMHTWLLLFNLFIFRLNLLFFFSIFLALPIYVTITLAKATGQFFVSLSPFFSSFDYYISNDILNSILPIASVCIVCMCTLLYYSKFLFNTIYMEGW